MRPINVSRVVLATLVSVLVFTGCSPTPTPSPTPAPALTTTPSQTLPAIEASPTPAETVLRIWLPPQFDPTNGTPAGDLLQERLDLFAAAHPGLRIEVRVKAESGPVGLLSTMQSASIAAPEALPDLVALPRRDMETAAASNLIIPIDNTLSLTDAPDWFDYARQLGRIDQFTYGLPFAGNALVLVQHIFEGEVVSLTWEPFLDITSGYRLVFAAADPQALVTLTLYQSAGGDVVNDIGRPELDPAILERVLEFFQTGFVFQPSFTYQTDEQVWLAYRNRQASAAILWASTLLQQSPASMLVQPLPGLDEGSYTLTRTWVWSILHNENENSRQALAAELVLFLTQGEFLAAWTAAAGYLPTRPSGLDAWPDALAKVWIEETIRSSHPLPPDQVLDIIGPVLRDAVVHTLEGQKTPQEAALEAADSLR
ncbi:MAG: extracellular solute-binding protein [Chloroflexota bacterium]